MDAVTYFFTSLALLHLILALVSFLLGLLLGWLLWGKYRRLVGTAKEKLAGANARISELKAALAQQR